MGDIITGYFNIVETVLLASHWLLSRVFAPDSGWTWAGAFALLAISYQLLMSPLSIHQIRSTLAMRRLNPRIVELQKEYENDRKQLVEEQQKLWKEAGTNPLTGCVPILIKTFVLLSFVALFFNTDRSSETLLSGEANRSFSDSSTLGVLLGKSLTDSIPTDAILLVVFLTAVMVGAEFLGRLQLIRTRMTSDPGGPYLQQETLLLYAMPLIWATAPFVVPLCGLFFFATWNVWELAQQYMVVHHEEPVA